MALTAPVRYIHRPKSNNFYGTGEADKCVASMLERLLSRLVQAHVDNMRSHPDNQLVLNASALNRTIGFRMGHFLVDRMRPTVKMMQIFERMVLTIDYRELVEDGMQLMVLVNQEIERYKIELARTRQAG